jgi:serine/threonine protein kinase
METNSRIKHFEIEELIGSGGMAEVFKAWDRKLNRHVAIKVIKGNDNSSEAIKRFISEARVLAQLNHPNITQVYDIFKIESRFYIVMEYLDGQDLSHYIKTYNIPLRDLLIMFKSLCDAFIEIHEAGILHRDIKPSNLFVTNRGVLKVIDFGISKWEQDPNNVETQKNFFVGSLQYTSPEVFTDGKQSISSDIYAFGLTLLYCVLGKHYFDGDSVPQILKKISHDDVSLPESIKSTLPDELNEFIQFTAEKDPRDRYASMKEVKESLRSIIKVVPKNVSTQTLRKLVDKPKPVIKKKSHWTSVHEEKWHTSLVNRISQDFFVMAAFGFAILMGAFKTYDYLTPPKTESVSLYETNVKENVNLEAPVAENPVREIASKKEKYNKKYFDESFNILKTKPHNELEQALYDFIKNSEEAKKLGIDYPVLKMLSIKKINKYIKNGEFDSALEHTNKANKLMLRKLKDRKVASEKK